MRIVSAARFLREQKEAPAEAPERTRRVVTKILADVRLRGDVALRDHTQRLDKVRIENFDVPREEWATAWRALGPELRNALRTAARAIQAYQRSIAPPARVKTRTAPGVELTTHWRPLARVACYAPGGRAAYPSTVLMTAVTARVARVGSVVVVSPPQQATGRPAAAVLAAAHVAGAHQVVAAGGAQAIAAMAYGTQTLARADKIVGPGNAYVTEAKRQLEGAVGTDGVAGPSELGVFADATADPELVAVDLAAQAEHDPEAKAWVVTDSEVHARRITAAVGRYIRKAARSAILGVSLTKQGVVVVARDRTEAARVLNAAGPEHVQVMARDAADFARQIHAAGTVFVGGHTPAALGDYVTGANHVLPTAGTARWRGPLSVYDFLRPVVHQRVSRNAAAAIGPAGAAIADAEGLGAHAESIRRRYTR